jgi:hypothetical protein
MNERFYKRCQRPGNLFRACCNPCAIGTNNLSAFNQEKKRQVLESIDKAIRLTGNRRVLNSLLQAR